MKKLTENCDSVAVVKVMKQEFSEMSIPRKIASDNRPQLDGEYFKTIAKGWCFNHVTSCLPFPQSNGQAESMVQTVNTSSRSVMNRNQMLIWLY